ncbi:MAG TPA: exodeoxyribonuclease VII large subunit, partial [Chloroflexota bacterium]|nr:exodeoxyribonuclease VII large subunit [Chloroflexota bacterium]
WQSVNRALLRAGPQSRLRLQRQTVDDYMRQMERAVSGLLRERRSRLEALEAQLRALDPLAVLARGYSVLFDAKDGTVISTTAQAQPGRRLRARVADGEFAVEVTRNDRTDV